MISGEKCQRPSRRRRKAAGPPIAVLSPPMAKFWPTKKEIANVIDVAKIVINDEMKQEKLSWEIGCALQEYLQYLIQTQILRSAPSTREIAAAHRKISDRAARIKSDVASFRNWLFKQKTENNADGLAVRDMQLGLPGLNEDSLATAMRAFDEIVTKATERAAYYESQTPSRRSKSKTGAKPGPRGPVATKRFLRMILVTLKGAGMNGKLPSDSATDTAATYAAFNVSRVALKMASYRIKQKFVGKCELGAAMKWADATLLKHLRKTK